MDGLAAVNTQQLFTLVVTAPFHVLGKYRALIEKRSWAWDIKEMVWNKVTQHWQPISNVPGLSVISNCEAMIVVFCKQPSMTPEAVTMVEATYYAHAELKWLCHHPVFHPSNFRETNFTLPVQDKKVEDTRTSKAVNKSEKPTAIGEYVVSFYRRGETIVFCCFHAQYISFVVAANAMERPAGR